VNLQRTLRRAKTRSSRSERLGHAPADSSPAWAWWAALAAVALVRAPHAFGARFFDADEAVNGLMGLSILRGEIPLYYWGQGYFNPVAALLAAPFLAVLPSARVATQCAPLLLHVAGVGLLAWLVGRAAGSRTAGLATLLAAALLPSPVGALLMEQGVRTVTVLCGVATWAFVLAARPSPLAGFALGLCAGLGWWNEPSVLMFLVPAAWHIASGWRRRRPGPGWLAATTAGIALGAGPHVYGVMNGLARNPPPPNWLHAVYPWPALSNLFGPVLSALLGADMDPSAAGALGPALAACALVGAAAIATLTWFAHRERGPVGATPRGLLLCADGAAVMFVLAWVVLSGEWFGGRRYVLLLWPSVAVWAGLGGAALWRRRRAAAGALLAIWTAAWGFGFTVHWRRAAAGEVPVTDAVALLEAEGVRGAFANYWASNLITLETRERIIVAQMTGVPLRHRAYYLKLDGLPGTGYLFDPARWPEDAGMKGAITAELGRRRIRYRTASRGEWDLVVPAGRGLPLSFINDLRLARGREEIRKLRDRIGGGR